MITSSISILKPPYTTFAKATDCLADIEPIDYFFAKQVADFIRTQRNRSFYENKESKLNDINQYDYETLFHLLIALHCANRSGDVCISINHLANKVFGFESDDQGVIRHQGYRFGDVAFLTQLLTDQLQLAQHEFPVVFVNDKLYLRRYYLFEQEVNEFIQQKTAMMIPFSKAEIGLALEVIDQLFPNVTTHATDDSTKDVDWQKIAVANALNKRFVVIAGGPGTGKTYTVTKLLAAVIQLYSKIPDVIDSCSQSDYQIKRKATRALKIALTAPTGKAAQRLSESISKAILGFDGLIAAEVLNAIPTQAQTIHRLLGVIPGQINFKHNCKNPLDLDVLLIDEVSMVDLPLMARLTRALPAHCRVVFLGDADQLPSVGAGCILADLAPRPHPGYSKVNSQLLKSICQTSNKFCKGKSKIIADHLTFLVHSRRFDGQGGIGRLATSVISGNCAESWHLLTSSNNPDCDTLVREQLRLLPTERQVWLAAHVKQFYAPLARSASLSNAFEQLSKYRILCATRVGKFGVDTLNDEVEHLLQRQGVIPHRQELYHGKPIMVKQNDYQLGLFNGDIGIIWRNENQQLMAVFEGDNGVYQFFLPSRLPQFETVYAMTIHKTQGSEFNHAVIVLPEQAQNRLLSRELLYTGITRGKNIVSISACKAVWQQTVINQTKRVSGLDLFRNGEK